MRLITGTEINYLFICHTKLWYFSKHIQMEQSSDAVSIGKFIHEDSYKREHELKFDGVAIDFIKKGNIIELHEIKKSNKMSKATEMQTLYYLYTLKNKGINAIASIDFPKSRECKRIELNDKNEIDIIDAINKVREIEALSFPPDVKRVPFCPKCAYYELCWSE